MPRLATVAITLLLTFAAQAQEPQPRSRAGEVYEIRISRESSQNSTDGSSGTTHDRDSLVERVIATRDNGLELEFDLPRDVPAEARASTWMYPVRVFKPQHGPLELLNGPELEGRVGRWLSENHIPREACGHWFFTWNAFQIECDPQEALDALAALELGTGLREGGQYQDVHGRGAGTLRRDAGGPGGATFVVELAVDPEVIRRERAVSDEATAQILGHSPLLEAQRQGRSAEQISGTIRITLETDAEGQVRRRTKVTRVNVIRPNGVRDNTTVTETVERQLIPRSPS